MNLPPSDFAAAFRAHVMPKLREMMESRGMLVALGLRDFGEALAEIQRHASKLGANYLPCGHFDTLLDWTGAALLESITKAEAIIDEHIRATAHVRADVERCDAAIIAMASRG